MDIEKLRNDLLEYVKTKDLNQFEKDVVCLVIRLIQSKDKIKPPCNCKRG